jgi:hypothetical protein
LDGELKEIAQATRAMGVRLHSHLSENHGYVDYTLERFGKRPVHWLADHDWLGPDVWFAHLVANAMKAKFVCWPKPAPAWPIACRPMPGLGPASHRLTFCTSSAAQCLDGCRRRGGQ